MDKIHVHIPYDKIENFLDEINYHRLNLEIYFTSPVLDTLQRDDIEKILKRFNYSPSLSIHAPFMDLSPGAIDSKVRAVTIERFTHILEIAEIISASHIVFHSGYEKWTYNHKIDTWLEKSLLTWEHIINKANRLKVRLTIENIFEDEPTNLVKLMEKLYHENFGVCFDTGHFNIFSVKPLEDWMEALAPYILQLHLHDNTKNADSHLAIGDGSFNFPKLLSYLKGKDCLYTIETHSPQLVLKSIERLKKLLS
ncbi:MAG: sugar phosphate isomerase/epimerase [Thermodesulfovibrionales bacterium]|nr:sugar phosphate isomerase/epimerase [Thermodesulfovibrionales bacterium]